MCLLFYSRASLSVFGAMFFFGLFSIILVDFIGFKYAVSLMLRKGINMIPSPEAKYC